MPQPCRWSCMVAAAMSYEATDRGSEPDISGHVSISARTSTRSDTRGRADPEPHCPARRRRWRLLERELDSALAGRTRAEDPPLGLLDRDVVDARLPAAHQAVPVELPQFV